MLSAAAGGDRDTSAVKAATPLRIVDAARPSAYHLPSNAARAEVTDRIDLSHERRFDRTFAAVHPPVVDVKGDSIRALLRDRKANRPGAIDARVEWRLAGGGSNLGLGGGLARVVDTILRD